jgi:predicted nucleotidyltransferase
MKETETTRTSIQLFLAELRQRLQAHYGARLAYLVLFGSQARGDAGPGSDIDRMNPPQATPLEWQW